MCIFEAKFVSSLILMNALEDSFVFTTEEKERMKLLKDNIEQI